MGKGTVAKLDDLSVILGTYVVGELTPANS